MRKAAAYIIVVLLIGSSSREIAGYTLGTKWLAPTTNMHVSLPGADGLWNATFISAMNVWNDSTIFKFTYNGSYFDPCSNPNKNGLGNGAVLSSTSCGESWGSAVLAVTISWSTTTTRIRVQSGIVFNDLWRWSVYDGPWTNSSVDFRRVAVHELGHVIGLGHENGVRSIMNSYAGDITTPQPDDIAGVYALYGGTPPDTTPPLLIITSPVNGQTVSTGSITLTGTATDAGQGNNGISFVTVNGERASGDTATGSGTASWSRNITLSAGANTLTITATDASTNKNSTTRTITVYCDSDKTPPSLAITSHRDGQTVSSSIITLGGTATDSGKGNSGIASVTVNGARATGDTAEGSAAASWSLSVNLGPGTNTITVAAKDKSPNQNVTIQSIKLILSQTGDTNSPTLVIAGPIDGQTAASSCISVWGAATDSGRGNNGISSVTVNGARASGDTVAGAGTASWRAAIPIKAGVNKIEVVATDGSPVHNETQVSITVFGQSSTSSRNAVPFEIKSGGGASVVTAGCSESPVTGYARIMPDWAGSVPAGVAIFGFRQNGALVTEAGVPASPLVQSGRIYAEVGVPVNTGLAIANPNSDAVTISFFFTDANGVNFGAGTTSIPANDQMAAFLNQAPFKGGSAITGTLTFNASLPVAAISLRSLKNERGEYLITTLPVAELSALTGATVIFPHFADGGGWTTQIVLVNPTDEPMNGVVQFFNQGSGSLPAGPASLTVDGRVGNSFEYSIRHRSSQRLQTSGLATQVTAGSIRVIPAANSRAPSGTAIFRFSSSGVIINEAGVPAVQVGSGFRLYVEASGSFGSKDSIQSGVAVVNLSSSPATLNVELTDLAGVPTGLRTTISVPAQGQISKFLGEIPGFSAAKLPFQGILRISTSAYSNIAVIGLRGRFNERQEFLITTIPSVNESTIAPKTELLFPHLADGGGYTTQFVVLGGSNSDVASGMLRFFSTSGSPLSLALK